MSNVAVLVLNYNGKQKLLECLRSLEKTDYDGFDTFLVDNASSDGSVEEVKRLFPKVEIKKLDENQGFIAYNQALSGLDYEYLVLLNNDILIVDKNWLSELLGKLSSSGDVAAVTPKIRLVNEKKINAAGGICDVFAMGINRGNGEVDDGQYDEPRDVFYGVGACLAIKKSAWDEVGGFDSRYFLYAEDLDWCWRAWLAGYRVSYVPSAVVEHAWHTSTTDSFMIYQMEKNQVSNFFKNYGFFTLLALFPFFLVLRVMKLFAMLFYYRQLEKSVALLKAYAWSAAHFLETLRLRKKVKRARKDRVVLGMMEKTSIELELGLKLRKHPFVA